MINDKRKWKGYKSSNEISSDEWYTPEYVVESLGKFDIDPCSAIIPPYQTAKIMYNKIDNGLSKEWNGRVWLNPPYSKDLFSAFIERLAEHGNGIALIFNRCDNVLFHEIILKKASAIKFLRKRIKFCKPDGTIGKQPGSGSLLIAFGEENIKSLEDCPLEGTVVYMKKQISL